MPRFLPALALVLLTAAPHALQRARFLPGGLDPAKPRLLGVVGKVMPLGGGLGPFADLDGDGDVDLLHSQFGQVSLHVNDGFGVFRRERTVSVADECRVAFFDADGDGRLDLLARTHLYLGTSSGGFVDASADLPPGWIGDVAVLEDFDGDLVPDIVAVEHYHSPGPARVRLALNDGAGHFIEGTSMPPSPFQPWTVAAADVDGDSDRDLVVAVRFDKELLWLNDGSGNFSDVPGAFPALFDDTKAAVLADLDGDTDPDLVFGNDYTNRMYRNDGSGGFSPAALPQPPEGKTTEAIVTLDREGDGDLDLWFLDSIAYQGGIPVGSSANRLLLNDGAGVFTETVGMPGYFSGIVTTFQGDLDGDADADLLLASDSSGRIYWNDGTGALELFPVSTGGGALGDVNGDGLPDGFSTDGVFLNGPPGVFTPAGTSLPPPLFTCWEPYEPYGSANAALGDVDGDGDNDAYIAVGHLSSECGVLNRMWINDGSANFTDETSTRMPPVSFIEVGGISVGTYLLPLDGDGDLDAACRRAKDSDGSGYSTCYENDGTGVFTHHSGVGTRGAGDFGDLDGDLDIDFFEGSYAFEHPNLVFLNDGDSNFTSLSGALPGHPVPLDAWTVALGDMDADGDLDAYVPTSSSVPSDPQHFVYINDGTGHFADEPGRVPARIGGWFIDLDLDGDVDLLAAGGTVRLFLNDGSGVFEDGSERVEPGVALVSLDLDLDGDPDGFGQKGLVRHLDSLGVPRIGKRHTFVVHGPAHTPFVLRQSLASTQIDMGSSGWLLIDPNQIVSIDGGRLDRDGEARVRFFVPNIPALIGFTSYWQAVVGTPLHATNLAVTTISGL